MSNVDLRAYVFLDSLQPQYAAFLATIAQGYLPTARQASLFVEISPGIEINRVTDIALKSTAVTPGMQIVERLYGMLEIHSDSQADVRAGRPSYSRCPGAEGRGAPQAQGGVQPGHPPRGRLPDAAHQPDAPRQHDHGRARRCTFSNASRRAYCALAANEAEKAAEINILEVRSFGSFGRLYLGGEERDIRGRLPSGDPGDRRRIRKNGRAQE